MAKERYTITPHSSGPGFTINLSNGSVDVPDAHGCYAISTGCGSGKTESIKNLIRLKHDQGILYCVDTIEELVKMYTWLISELCNDPAVSLRLDDIAIIVSGEDAFKQNYHDYMDDPDLLLKKKVVLITHTRFWSDDINRFLIYRPVTSVDFFDADFGKLMSRADLRKYIIFDETPLFIKDFVSFPKHILGIFSQQEIKGGWKCKSDVDIRKAYEKFLKGTEADFYRSTSRLFNLRRETVLKLIPQYYEHWMRSSDKNCQITFKPSNLCQPGINTHVLVYEGAGDILLGSSSFYQLLDIQGKYNSNVVFSSFPFKFRRDDTRLNNNYKKAMDEVVKIICNESGKVLLVVWKSYGEDRNKDSNMNFIEAVEEELDRRGIDKARYKVTYYGATDTKSTNLYQDYRAIILMGRWGGIKNNDTAWLRECYGTDTTNEEHRLWYFVQLVSRIGIRKRDGQDYRVYYSEDIGKNFISRLSDYFNNIFIPNKHSGVLDWEKKIDEAGINRSIKKRIKKLCKAFSDWQEYIRQGPIPVVKVSKSLKEIHKITPHSRKPLKRNYEPLVKALKTLGIELEITTN